jgi:hypothetical protein
MVVDNEDNAVFENGYNLFKRESELILAEVWRRATKLYAYLGDQHEYVEGYKAGRRQRDEFTRERQNEAV